MGIFSRISKVLESNLNALLDKAEDPAKLLDQAIEDMKKGREDARRAIVEARTQKRLLEKKHEKSAAEAAELERKAMLALKAGDEALARKLLESKLAADKRAEGEAAAIREQDSQVQHLEAAEKELDRRIHEMPAKRAVLLARQATAEAKGARVGASNRGQDSVRGAIEAFDRMEEKIVRAEVEAEVLAEGQPHLLESRAVEQLATEDALAQLKEKVKRAQLPPGPTSGEKGADEARGSAHVDAVEDSLRALKAKLNE